MLVARIVRYSIALLLVGAASISLLSRVAANVQLVHQWREARASKPVHPASPEQRTVVGATLLQRGDPEETVRLLLQNENLGIERSQFISYIIGKAYQNLDNPLEAGLAFERAGLFTQLNQAGSLANIRIEAPDEAASLATIALAVAQHAEEQASYAKALEYIGYIRQLSVDPENLAESYRIEAVAAFSQGEQQHAILAIRQSLEIIPAQSSDDPRIAYTQHIALEVARTNNCQYTERDRLFSLLVVYSPQASADDAVCIEQVTDSALATLPSAMQPYLLLRKALAAQSQGNTQKAQTTLNLALSSGLPAAWAYILGSPANQASLPPVGEPTYSLTDTRLIGYELDPMQVELGLPLDILLVYRKGSVNQQIIPAADADLRFLHTINLAPNPGFEYASATCLEPCLPTGFEEHVYSGPIASKDARLVQTNRPFIPTLPDSVFSSYVLKLTNNATDGDQGKRSGLESFSRSVTPGASYLQAGWIKSMNGQGFFGRQWEEGGGITRYMYVISGYTEPTWNYASQIYTTPVDSTHLKVWELNFDSSGDVLFDGMLLIKLP